jgi:type III pantothenate kinase
MLLAIDIGNTNICLGVFKGKKLLYSWRLATNKEITGDEYGLKILSLLNKVNLRTEKIKDVIISNVVPPLTGAFNEISQEYFHRQPLTVTVKMKTGLKICYSNPEEIGADRIVDAVAGYHLFGAPLIIVDFGTATTFDCIGKMGTHLGGVYIGGMIAPGINISAEALYTHTAKLPRVEIIKPERIIGKNTVESMQAGIFYGYIGLVEYLIQCCKKELIHLQLAKSIDKINVIATGGLAELIANETKTIEKVVPELTLEGLRIIWELNKNANKGR